MLIATVTAGCVLCLTGCMSKTARAQLFYKQAVTNRTLAANAMATAWRSQEIKLDDCMDLAFARLEADKDAASLAFAGAVLDFAAQIEKDLPKGDEFLLLWFRIGGLAGQSATLAYNLNDPATAESLMLAGPGRWRSDAYWERHPNHDALVARVKFLRGHEQEALQWLRRHDVMDEELLRAQGEIVEAIRARNTPGN